MSRSQAETTFGNTLATSSLNQKTEKLTGMIEGNLRSEIQNQKDYIQALTNSLKSKSNHIIKLSETIESFEEQKIVMEISWKNKLDAQKDQLEKEKEEIKQKLEQKLQNTKRKFETEMQQTKLKYETESKELHESFQKDKKRLENELQQTKLKFEAETKQLIQTFQKEKQQESKKTESEYKQVKNHYESEISHYKEDIQRLVEQNESLKLQVTEMRNSLDNLKIDRDKHVRLHLQSTERANKLEGLLNSTREKSERDLKELDARLKRTYENDIHLSEKNLEIRFNQQYQNLLEKMEDLKRSRENLENELDERVQKSLQLKEAHDQIKYELNQLVKEHVALRDENSNFRHNYMPKDEFQRATEHHMEVLKRIQNETRQIVQSIEQSQVYDATKSLQNTSRGFSKSVSNTITDFKALQNVFLGELERLSNFLSISNSENQKLRKSLTQRDRTLSLWMKQQSILFNSSLANHSTFPQEEKSGILNGTFSQSKIQTQNLFATQRPTLPTSPQNVRVNSFIDAEMYHLRIQELEEQNEKLQQQNFLIQDKLSNIQNRFDMLQGNEELSQDDTFNQKSVTQRAFLESPNKQLSDQMSVELYKVNLERREFEELLLKKLVLHICELQNISDTYLEEKIHLDIMNTDISQDDTTERIAMEIGNAIRQLGRITTHFSQVCQNKSNLIQSLQKDVKKQKRQLTNLKNRLKLPDDDVLLKTPEQKEKRPPIIATYTPTTIRSDESLRTYIEKILPYTSENIESTIHDLVSNYIKSSKFITSLNSLVVNPFNQTIADRYLVETLGHIVVRNDEFDDQDVQIINIQKLLVSLVKIIRESKQIQNLLPIFLHIEKEVSSESSFNDSKQTLLRVKMHVEKLKSYLHRQPSSLEEVSKLTQSSTEENEYIVDHAKSLFNVTHSRDLIEKLEQAYLENKARETLYEEYSNFCQSLKSILEVEHSSEIINRILKLKKSDSIVSILDEKIPRSPKSVQNYLSKHKQIVKNLCIIMEVQSSKDLEPKALEWKEVVNHVQRSIKEFTGEFMNDVDPLVNSDFLDRYLDS